MSEAKSWFNRGEETIKKAHTASRVRRGLRGSLKKFEDDVELNRFLEGLKKKKEEDDGEATAESVDR